MSYGRLNLSSKSYSLILKFSGCLIIYFHIRCSFLITFCTSFWKRVHNSKEIVNIQDLFVLTVGYADMTTYPLAKYYYVIEGVYFIYTLFKSFISTLSFLLFLHIVSWRYKRDYLHPSIDVLCYIMFYIINTTKKNSFIPRWYLRYKKGPDFHHRSSWSCTDPASSSPTLLSHRYHKHEKSF